jgi:hypothetical protein
LLPQTDSTSPTQTASQLSWQQNGSALQIWSTQLFGAGGESQNG